MASITTYDLATGEIGSVRSGSSIEELIALLREGQGFVEGEYAPRLFRVDVATGQIIERE